jgi:hypothetical protein
LTIHRNKEILFNCIFGKIWIQSPYLWLSGESSKPLLEMRITHNGRSETVNRALSDFGIEESFSRASKRFHEHYHFTISPSAVDRTTKNVALQAEKYIKDKLQNADELTSDQQFIKTMLAELDGCEIRTIDHKPVTDDTQRTPVYNNQKKEKIIKWRDVRIGFVRDLDLKDSKTFVGGLESYPAIVSQMNRAAILIGLTPETNVVGVSDGAPGLSDELKRQFPQMQFILDKTHLKDHLYDTAEKLEIAKSERKAWGEPRLRSISKGNVATVLTELKDLNETESNERLRQLIGYIEKFKEAVNYNKFKANDYPIGSGEIESAHKSIPQKRLKIPGAGWKEESINPMVALRILRANEWWENFWNQRTEQLLTAA